MLKISRRKIQEAGTKTLSRPTTESEEMSLGCRPPPKSHALDTLSYTERNSPFAILSSALEIHILPHCSVNLILLQCYSVLGPQASVYSIQRAGIADTDLLPTS